jgi:hypothetical protein
VASPRTIFDLAAKIDRAKDHGREFLEFVQICALSQVRLEVFRMKRSTNMITHSPARNKLPQCLGCVERE